MNKEIRKVVKNIGNGGHVVLTKQWVGKYVIIRLEEEDESA